MATLTHDRSSAFPGLADLLHLDVDFMGGLGARRDLLRAAIAQYGGYCDWSVDHTGWVVTLYLPEERTFSGRTLEDGLIQCLSWLGQQSGGEPGSIAAASSCSGVLGPARSATFRAATPLSTAQIPADDGNEDQRRLDQEGER
jgi:hypothetical protein